MHQSIDLRATLALLPRDHVVALRGALSGLTVEELATLVGVPAEAVVPMLRVGVAKLGRALTELGENGPDARQ